MKKIIYIVLLGLIFTTCGKATKKNYMQLSQLPGLFPDYTNISIPYNIAPLNFRVQDTAAASVSIVVVGKERYSYQSRTTLMQFPEKQWRKMMETEKGGTLDVYITINHEKQDIGYQGFTWTIAAEPIDKYLSYRLIEPAYEVWNRLQIEERDVECFKTRLLGDNRIADYSCMNCHISNNGKSPATFMHIRGKQGGTIYAKEGKIRKINTKTDKTSAAVYGEISQNGRYGIFTTADIIPILHSKRNERLEVYDRRSDLILIDFELGTVRDSPLVSGTDFQETFPCFSADNRTIYFCRAKYLPQPDSTKQMQYNLYSMPFNPDTGQWGDTLQLVIDAASLGKSVSFPKCSPDGKWLLLTVSDYGTFPIWHVETDLWMLHLSTGTIYPMQETNGRFSDSYHSWSSNSKWIVFASKRDDRVYGRPYFAYVNDDGTTTKAFVLPQKDPEQYSATLKSFNIPELYTIPETYDAHRLARIYQNEETEQLHYNNY